MHRHSRLCVLLLSALLVFALAAFAADAGASPRSIGQLFDCRLCRVRRTIASLPSVNTPSVRIPGSTGIDTL
jgi:hypothetical protein